MSATSSRSLLLGRSNRYMDSGSPSMVHRAGDTLVVRSVVSGTSLNIPGFEEPPSATEQDDEEEDDDDLEEVAQSDNLPQCKIKRNYTCTHCSFYTQNPRTYLYHLKDEHKERIRVYECPKCVYASKHSQKLQRHIHMVHVVGRQNAKLGKKLPLLAPKSLPPPPPLTRAGPSGAVASTSRAEDEAADDTDDEEGLVMSLEGDEPAEELEEMDDCEEEGEEEEEDEMMLDNSGQNSSTENDPEPGTSAEEIKCTICPFTSHSRTLVQRHENIAHLKKKFFRCTKCNYVTHMKARFTKHVKYHSMPMIKCDLCDFRTPYKWNLDRHYKNHQGDGEFKCPMCNFTADIKQSLTVHVQNHHLTPQQRLMRGMGRRNKVGASDAPAKELRMADVGLVGASGLQPPPRTSPPSQPPVLLPADQEDEGSEEEDRMEHDDDLFQNSSRRQPKIKVTLKKVKGSSHSTQEQNERHHFESDFIHPDDVLHKNGKIYYKNLKCNYCSFRAFWEGDILRHENKVHGVDNPRNVKVVKKRQARPIPNLIPLQQQTTPSPPSILRVPSLSGQHSPPSSSNQEPDTPVMSEQDINEICSKSSTSALKDFASLIGEAFPGDEPMTQETTETAVKPEQPQEKAVEIKAETIEPTTNEKETPEKDTSKESSEKETSPSTPTQTSTLKRKSTSFFDKLKEKLIGQEASNLVCEHCGHESKCLSEALCHQKIHKDEENETSPSNQRAMAAMVGVSSTRCQHCRHRCKTSADLLVHLQSCLSRDSTSDGQGEDETQDEGVPEKEEPPQEEQEPPQCPNCEQRFDTEDDLSKHLDYCKPRLELNPEVSITEVKPQELHPMENKVFVWNQLPASSTIEELKPTLTIERIPAAPRAPAIQNRDNLGDEDDDEDDYEGEGSSLVGFETAPGFGSVTNQMGKKAMLKPSEDASHVQRVYKCPKCNFWASAASRFHIHLVGHLNRKPFGCSQCDYRSNWRWDVAKHIRLKGVRDPAHAADSRPRVLVHDDDSSRRNYSKYNKFLTLMTVRLGQTQSDSPPPASTSLPAPPRLIPAPTVPSLEVTSPRQQPLRPPPPLRAATQHVLSQLAEDTKRGVKRPLFGEGSSQAAPDLNKPPEPGTKRLLWRCKKCNYRGIDKEEVLAHVRTHYQNTPLGAVTISPASQPNKPEQHANSQLGCDKCPFVARWQGELYSHQQHHVPQAGAIFKCYLCPFYVATKRELLSHMRIHGVNEPEDYLSRAMQAKMAAATATSTKSNQDNEEDGYIGPAGAKRYKCGSCPYETNSKSQLVYHRQLHGGSSIRDEVTVSRKSSGAFAYESEKGPPFRCHVCSYAVAKRHLLHQHLRVHGIVLPPTRVNPSSTPTMTIPSQMVPVDVSKLADVPLVWVLKNGKYLKMFKCRFCPHVNLRKVNIQEHEKMHKTRKNSITASTAMSDPSGMIHRCPQCSYQCNNAGVLSAHAKVHQDWYPRSCALVDLNRSDDVQVKELGGEMAEAADLDDSELEQPEAPGTSSIVSGTMPEVITITPQLSITLAESNSNGMQQDEEQEEEEEEEDTRLLFFCRHCPARFLFSRELAIHRRFHRIRLQHHCPSCNYTARQPSHLQAHAKVHTHEYQDRTQLLLQQHQMSGEHYKPVTVQKDGVWIVVDDPFFNPPPKPIQFNQNNSTTGIQKQFSCTRCPAKFFKNVALNYHMTLHGGPGPYKCKSCDYSVKMYGNLVRHEPVHGKDGLKPSSDEYRPPRAAMSMACPKEFMSLSGTDLFHHREAQKLNNGGQEFHDGEHRPIVHPAQPLPADPVFGTLMHGNPKFIYPTYFKNGKMKEKRYKCHKCPSAFEKREQYKVHLSLHGAKQKYRCERCDYSVKYYANFIQHIRKHKYNDEAKQAAGEEEPEEDASMAVDEETPSVSTSYTGPQRTAGKSISQPAVKHGIMPTAERQQLMLQQRRKGSNEDSLKDEQISIVPSYWCPHCPYNSMRRDGVETHSKRHLCNNPAVKTPFVCQHCDYIAPQSHFLREHNKLHFRWKPQPPGRRPETFMQCDRVELWSHILGKENEEDGEKKMVFQDKGCDVRDHNERFFPQVCSDNDEEDDGMYIDLRTGEVISDESERVRVETKEAAAETAPCTESNSEQQADEPSDSESSSESSSDDAEESS